MSTSMKFSQALAVISSLPETQAILIRGGHGIGKSTLIKRLRDKVSQREGIDYELIDRRLAQMTEGDMMGLPSVSDGTTRWNPPDFISQVCRKACVLNLDELNRASREVQNVGLQLTLDRELSNGAKLHPKTIVCAAVNTGKMYQVNRMDPALLDRFCVIDLVFDFQEWLKHAKEVGISSVFLDFVIGTPGWVETPANADPNEKTSSPRSATTCGMALTKLLNEGKTRLDSDEFAARRLQGQPTGPAFDRELIERIAATYMGNAFADAFDEHLRELEMSQTSITGEKIYESWTSLRQHLDLTRIDLMTSVVDRFTNYVHNIPCTKDQKIVIPEHVGQNFRQLLLDVPTEQRTLIYQSFLKGGMDRLPVLEAFHPYGVDLLLAVYGTVPGEKGIGMLPTNPGAVVRKTKPAEAAQ